MTNAFVDYEGDQFWLVAFGTKTPLSEEEGVLLAQKIGCTLRVVWLIGFRAIKMVLAL